MRAFLHLFFGLLIPLSALFMVVSFLYFSTGYNFTKAMRQGVLYGFFIAIVISLFIALLLFIMRNMKKMTSQISPTKKQSDDVVQSVKKDIKLNSNSSAETRPSHSNGDNEYKLMLLMDKALAFEVSLYAISEENIGTASLGNSLEEIKIHTNHGIIHLTISTLTRHTSKIVIHAKHDSEEINKLITYIKEKELSFLQY
jgi:uncharacterized membrane protein